VQRLNDLKSLLLPVNLLDDALVDALALIAESGLQTERRTLFRLHKSDAGRDGFEEGDGTEVGFDVVVVLVTLLLRSVKRFLVRVLALRDEAFVGGVRRLRDWKGKERSASKEEKRGKGEGRRTPLVVKHLPTESVTTGAVERNFLCVSRRSVSSGSKGKKHDEKEERETHLRR
jgi:hypothetical protein